MIVRPSAFDQMGAKTGHAAGVPLRLLRAHPSHERAPFAMTGSEPKGDLPFFTVPRRKADGPSPTHCGHWKLVGKLDPMRPAIAMALLGFSSAACSSGPAVERLFNNERDYERAYSAHLAAWDRQVGRSTSAREVEDVFRQRGGECSWAQNQLGCAVDVRPRYLSLTQRIMWSMSFVQDDGNRVRLVDARLHHLGFDV